MTVAEAISYYKTCKENYAITDDRIKNYPPKERRDNYIGTARDQGTLGIPSHKWHFIECWYPKSIHDGTIKSPDDDFSRYYGKFKCIELLLWLAEAADVAENKLKEASKTSSPKEFRSIISWKLIESAIKQPETV